MTWNWEKVLKVFTVTRQCCPEEKVHLALFYYTYPRTNCVYICTFKTLQLALRYFMCYIMRWFNRKLYIIVCTVKLFMFWSLYEVISKTVHLTKPYSVKFIKSILFKPKPSYICTISCNSSVILSKGSTVVSYAKTSSFVHWK